MSRFYNGEFTLQQVIYSQFKITIDLSTLYNLISLLRFKI